MNRASAVNGMVSIDRKKRLPFAAILAGRTRFDISEFRAWQIVLAVALFAGVFWLHGIVGPSPLFALQN